MESGRYRPLTGLARAAGGAVVRALPGRRRSAIPASAGDRPVGPSAVEAAPAAKSGRSVDGHGERTVDIRILGVTDFHGALVSPGQRDGRPVGGAAALAAHLRRAREERPGQTLVFHNGDVVGHSPAISGLLQDEPAVAVLNAIGFDAGVVGTHEFDEGLDELFRLLDGGAHPTTLWRNGSFPGCSHPWLAANVVSEASGHPILPAYRVFDAGGVRVGVIGVVTAETPRRIGGGTGGLHFADEAATVNRYARELRQGPEQVAAVVVLAHLGGTVAPAGQPGGSIGGPMARFAAALEPGVDAVIGGHLHAHSYVATIGPALVVQAAPLGTAYAALDLRIDPVERRVVHRSAALTPVWADAIAPDPEVAAIVARAERIAAPLAAERIATLSVPFRREPAGDTGSGHLGHLVARAFQQATGAEIAVVHPAELRVDLPAGPLTRAEVYEVLPAGHGLVTLRLTGEQLRRFLEEQWHRDRTSRLHLAGLIADIVPEAPRGQRVRRPRRPDGTPLDRARPYTVAMTGFLAGGGDGFRVPLTATDRTAGPRELDAVVAYLRKLPQPVTNDHLAAAAITGGTASSAAAR